MTQLTTESKPKKRASNWLIKGAMTRVKSILDTTDKPTTILLKALTGFVFGFSVAVGLGLNQFACFVFGAVAALGVLACGSLVAYLLTQTIVLAGLAVFSQLAFRLIPDFKIEVAVFQSSYLLLIVLIPSLSLIRKVRSATNYFAVSKVIELVTSVVFAGLIQFLRSRMPVDAEFALNIMFEGEDNAGIVEVLSGSLKDGFTPQAGQFGEFINSIYLATAGLIGNFSISTNQGLLPVLTHYNITLLLMAWVPIVALFALVLSGRKFKNLEAIVIVTVISVILGILFWPFVQLGHTSVISSGLFATSLLATTLNKQLAIQHPMLLASLVSSFAFIVGTSWAPLMPFASATVLLAFFYIGYLEYIKGNVKVVTLLLGVFFAISFVVLPGILQLVVNSGGLLDTGGGTRMASLGLVVLSLVLFALTMSTLLRRSNENNKRHSLLFLAATLALVASILYLLVSGLARDQDGFGYGATKYLLTAISFSMPLLWMLAIEKIRPINYRVIAVSGLVLVLLILMIQPDSRKVPAAIVAPQLTSWQFLAPRHLPVHVTQSSAIASAINGAFEENPDHIFCVSDFGIPVTADEVNFPSYFCNRWVGSLNNDQESFKWGAIPLGVNNPESLSDLLRNYAADNVTLIRIMKPSGANAKILDISQTWWFKYTDPSWKIITVAD